MGSFEKLLSDMNELFYTYSYYLKLLNRDDFKTLVMLLEVRTKLEEELGKLPNSEKFEYRDFLLELDKVLKRKLLTIKSEVNFEKLRNMGYPSPSVECWWYYIDMLVSMDIAENVGALLVAS